MEEWRDIRGWEGRYQVSSKGRVRNWRGAIIGGRMRCNGYPRLALSKDGRPRWLFTHRLVADAFIGPCPDGMQVNHKNGIRDDNRSGNLEYVTPRENMAHKHVTGTAQVREKNGRARLTPSQVDEIRKRREGGELIREIATDFGVHKNTVWWIVTGQTWQTAT